MSLGTLCITDPILGKSLVYQRLYGFSIPKDKKLHVGVQPTRNVSYITQPEDLKKK